MVANPITQRSAAARHTVAIACGVLALSACDTGADPEAVGTRSSPDPVFVGSAACTGCHQDETERWSGSHHDLAMQGADEATVLGDFNETEFRYADVTTRFFRRDDGYWVRTDGPDGVLAEFEVVATFGVEPLQQYLVELGDGRMQALSTAWDSRPAEAGGQRWFHLYPTEAIDSDDPLHWTGVYQSWNTMCAECHSTNLIKAYDTAADRFATEYASIDVGCEACHGPGSAHASDPSIRPPALPGSVRRWVFEPGESIASLNASDPANAEIEVCAQCHSRRAQLTDDYLPGDRLLDAYQPALLQEGLYHADGQILDEVYVYGSFAQSAMAAAGVTCSDCHDPHGSGLRAEGNAVCGQCHLASTYDQPSHHRHEAASEAAECTACHMRTETYMVVDPRHDHSFRVPRPDLSAAIGSPNACNDCHSDQSSEWAAESVAEWFPQGRRNEGHFGLALHAGRTWAADARSLLTQLIDDEDAPVIARATALGLLAERTTDLDTALIERSLDREPLIVLAGIDATAVLPPALRIDLAQRFLTDDRRAIRSAAARVLLPARALLSPTRQQDLDAALREYVATQSFNSDRPEGLLNLAGVAIEQGRYVDGETILREAIGRHPRFSALYVNLADLYRLMDRSGDSEQILRNGLAVMPDDPALSFSLALAVVRAGRPAESLPLFNQAAQAAPELPYYQFLLAMAFNDLGDNRYGLQLLRETHQRFPGHADTLLALATLLRDAGEYEEAYRYAVRLADILPGDPNARALKSELEQRL
jgi:predicted CXXCH cytochrome family protein